MDLPYVLVSEEQADPSTTFMHSQKTQESLTQVTKLHRQLRERLRWQDESVEGLLLQMLHLQCTVDQKCMTVDVKKFIGDNDRIRNGLESLQKCFGILCKYAQNLLVSAERRPPNWKNVKFTNATFIHYVSFIKGSEGILSSLGYTISTPEGMAFPPNSEPDAERIANITADLKIFYTEMSSYNMGNHPNPEYFEPLIPYHWRLSEREQYPQTQGMAFIPGQQQFPEGQGYSIGQGQHPQFQGQQYPQVLGQEQQYSQYPQVLRQEQQYSQGKVQGQMYSQHWGHDQQHPQSGVGQVQGQQYPQVHDQGQTYLQVQGQGKQHPQSQGGQPFQDHILGHYTGQGDQEEDEFHDAQEDLTTEYQGQDCDICGSEKATIKCPDCDGKQLCKSCDHTWHSHPRRTTHERLFMDKSGNWITRSFMGAKPKVPPDKPGIKGHGDPGGFEGRNNPYSSLSNLPRPPIEQVDKVSDDLPNLSIFSEKRPCPQSSPLGSNVVPTIADKTELISLEEESSNRNYYQHQGRHASNLSDNSQRGRLTSAQTGGRVLLNEIKSIQSKEDQVTRIRQELGQLDIILGQCEQELNIVLKDDDFEDNPEYSRLSKQRDHINRNKLLLNEYWKDLEREKNESKKAKRMMNAESVGDNQGGVGLRASPVNISYPPGTDFTPRTTAFDFERDMEFPVIKSPVQQKDVPNKDFVPEKGESTVLYTTEVRKPKVSHPEATGLGNRDAVYKPGPKRVPSKPIAWVCDFCTFHNDLNSKQCHVCLQESERPSLVYDDINVQTHTVLHEENEHKLSEAQGQTKELTKPEVQGKVTKNTGEYRSVFVDIQDDVIREKQEAKERYLQKLKERGQFDEDEVTVKRPPQSGMMGSIGEKNSLEGRQQLGDIDPIIHPVLKLDLSKGHGVGTFPGVGQHSATLPPQVKPETTVVRPDLAPSEDDRKDMQSTLEQIQIMKEQEEAAIHSREVIRMLRKAEIGEYSMKEIEMAMEQSEFSDPFYWLDIVWPDQIQAVMKRVDELLVAENPSWGGLSLVPEDEARQALQDSGGYLEEAADTLKQNLQTGLNDLFSLGVCSETEVIKALKETCSIKAAELVLYNEFFGPYRRKIGTEEEGVDGSPVVEDLGTILEQKLRNKDLEEERRIRMVLCEFSSDVKSWGRGVYVVQLLEEMPEDVTLTNVIEAVRQCGDREQAYNFLQQECSMCFSLFPASKILSLTLCQCKVCRDCMKQYFEVQIKERHIKNLCCPTCQLPEDVESEEAENHLHFLHNFLQTVVSPEVFHIFEDKVRDWHLMKDPNFRWCSSHNCENGFIFNPVGNRLKMRCDRCNKFTCFKCKKPWAEQHENVSCERFKAWQEANNPEFQEAGLARHLQENGIDCPKCKMRYSLAKGGCMHFKCTQCGHEFCCGCNRPFLNRGACKELKSCESQGLHCHHPRDCLYYLRDSNVDQLQELLEDNDIGFRADNPEYGDGKCLVMEQKETQAGLRDEPCGKEVQPNQSGLCVIHYKEYLVSQINAHAIDPVTHMNLEDVKTLFRRKERQLPPKQQTESDTQYKQRLINEVKQNFKLDRRAPVII